MADFPFILDDAPATPSTPTGGQIPGVARDVSTIAGYGLDRPFRRGPADFVAVGGDALLSASIAQILTTRASSEFSGGELPWRSSFGSLLHRVRFANNNAVAAELARQYVVDAIARWEPRIRIVDVEITREKPNGRDEAALAIRVRYVLRSVRSTGADVYETTVEV